MRDASGSRLRRMSDFVFHELFPLGADDTPYRKLTGEHVSEVAFAGNSVLKIELPALTLLAQQAMVDCQHLLRPGHLRPAARHPRRSRGVR